MSVHLIALAIAAPAPPQQAAPPQGPSEQSTIVVEGQRPDPDQVICEKVVATGSRVNVKRTCATRREWDAMRQADREAVDDTFRRTLQRNEPPH